MKKILLLASLILPLAFFACRKGPDTPAPQPDPYAGVECATLDATDISSVSAMLHGYFNSSIGHERLYYFLVANKESICNLDSLMKGANVLSFAVLPPEGQTEVVPPPDHKLQTLAYNLLPDTTYFVRALVYGIDTVAQKDTFVQAENVKSFRTNTLQLRVITKDATGIEPLRAVVNGQLETNAGKDAPISVKFYYSRTYSTLEDLIKHGDSTNWQETYGDERAVSDTLIHLPYATTFHYVFCANVSGKDYYGEIKSFTTTDYNPVVTTLAAVPGPVKAALNASVTSSDYREVDYELWFMVGPEGSTIEFLKESGTKVWGNVGSDYASFSATTQILKMSTTYCYAAFAKIAGKEVNGDVVSFTTTSRTVPSDAVEMGLSVFWAPKNVGADSPEGYGDFYAWGEVETKSDYSNANYKWCKGASSGANGYTKYNSSNNWGPVVDNKHFLEPEDDAATVVLGSAWRMPTANEWRELLDYCDWVKKTVGENAVFEITSHLTGNSIILPIVGLRSGTGTIFSNSLYYFSNEIESGFVPFTLRGDADAIPTVATSFRYYGTNIRAVRE